MGISCNPIEWRSSSTANLEVSKQYNRNNCPSIPLARSVNTKKEYQNITILLNALKYEHHEWVGRSLVISRWSRWFYQVLMLSLSAE